MTGNVLTAQLFSIFFFQTTLPALNISFFTMHTFYATHLHAKDLDLLSFFIFPILEFEKKNSLEIQRITLRFFFLLRIIEL